MGGVEQHVSARSRNLDLVVVGALGFLVYGRASGRLRRLILPALLLGGVAVYET